jgi:hypothetical protein
MTDLLKCPICDKPLQPDDLCASDIEMGACHAECLEGSPVVDIDTGEATPDAKVDTFRAREIMEPGCQQRDKFESAVVKRLQESGFLEIEIRTECLARVGQGYQDEVINAGWHYWNEALWQNIPLVDPGLGRFPDGLDFATPDEIFDKGPEAVRQWQEARGRKPDVPAAAKSLYEHPAKWSSEKHIQQSGQSAAHKKDQDRNAQNYCQEQAHHTHKAASPFAGGEQHDEDDNHNKGSEHRSNLPPPLYGANPPTVSTVSARVGAPPAPSSHVALRPHEPTPEMLAAAMRADQDGMPASMKTIWMVMWGAYSPAALATTEGSTE